MSAYPPVMLQAYAAMATYMAPTPQPTLTPTPAPLDTPTPTFYCPSHPDTLPAGTICRGVAGAPDTPTPMPRCHTPPVANLDCEVRPLPPTPTPVTDTWPVGP